MAILYSVKVSNGTQIQYYRADFYIEALNLAAKLFDKLGDNIKVLVKKLIYDNKGALIDTIIKMDIWIISIFLLWKKSSTKVVD